MKKFIIIMVLYENTENGINEEKLYNVLLWLSINDIVENIYNKELDLKIQIGNKETYELKEFLESNTKIKDWLRVRLVKIISSYIGLIEYLRTLISFRTSKPSLNAPINTFFTTNYIVRGLDPIVSNRINKLIKNKKIKLTKYQQEALNDALATRLDFRLKNNEVYFNIDEVERLRNLLLEDFINIYDTESTHPKINRKSLTKLKKIDKLKTINLDILMNISKKYPSLDIIINSNVIEWIYPDQPIIYIINKEIFYDPEDMEKFTINNIKRQIFIIKNLIHNNENVSNKTSVT